MENSWNLKITPGNPPLSPKKSSKTYNTLGKSLKFAKFLAQWPSHVHLYHDILIFFSLFYFVSNHSQSLRIFYGMCSVQTFPFLDRHGCGCYSGPYQLFYADPKVEETVNNGKSWGINWNISGLEISGKQIFYPLNIC